MSYTNFKKASINKIPGYPAGVRQDEEVAACKYFIEKYFRHTDKLEKFTSSYGIKHIIENWLRVCYKTRVPDMFPFGNHQYVSNEALITAMAEKLYESSPVEKDSPNLVFKFKYIGPKFYDTTYGKYEMPRTEQDWEKILKVV